MNKRLAEIAEEFWDDVLTMQGKVKLLHAWQMQHGLCTRKFHALPAIVQIRVEEECESRQRSREETVDED